jgi:hypothetical protein
MAAGDATVGLTGDPTPNDAACFTRFCWD